MGIACPERPGGRLIAAPTERKGELASIQRRGGGAPPYGVGSDKPCRSFRKELGAAAEGGTSGTLVTEGAAAEYSAQPSAARLLAPE